MKAVFIEQFDGVPGVRYGDVPDLIRADDEVLVKMEYASLNHHDIYSARGEAGQYALPLVLGCDGVGTVLEAPAGSSFRPGEHVVMYPVVSCGNCMYCALGLEHRCFSFGMVGGERQGTFAEHVSLPEKNLVRLPEALSPEIAACLPVAGLTAWNMVQVEGRVKSGEHILVMGASGGVGVIAVLLLKSMGAVVYAHTSKSDKAGFLRELGADHVFDGVGGLINILKVASGLPHRGFDAALNYVGGKNWRYVLPSIRSSGRIYTCGAVGGAVAEIDQRQVFYRQLSIFGCSMGSRSAMEHMLDYFTQHRKMSIPVDSVVGLPSVGAAMAKMESGNVLGKIVVQI